MARRPSVREQRLIARAMRDFERHAARRAHIHVPVRGFNICGIPVSFEAYRHYLDRTFAESDRQGKSNDEVWDDILNGGQP